MASREPQQVPRWMRAAVLTGPRLIEVRAVPVPRPGAGQVLIHIEGCGLCGSDLPLWQGRRGRRYPAASGEPGHEGWGRVTATGSGVREEVNPGDRVVALSYRALAEYDVAAASSVVVLPRGLDDAPLLGEPLGCVMNIFRRSDVRRDHRVAVVGVGFIGAALVQLAARAGAEVIAISRRAFARQIARTMGAAQALPLDDGAVDHVLALSHGVGCDRVIEAAGRQRTLDVATRLVRVRGRLIIAGYHQDGPRSVDMQRWNWRGLDVINAHERAPAAYVDGMRAAVDAVVSGRFDPAPLYTHQFSLDEVADAFAALEGRPDGFLKAQVRL